MRRSPPPPAALSAAPSRWSWFTLSEETRDYVNRVTEYGKRAIYYGWLPLILVLGFWKSEPRPSIFRAINPLS